MSRQPIAMSKLTAQLRALGVPEGGVLLVHTSFSRIGPVENGPLGLIGALQAPDRPGEPVRDPIAIAGRSNAPTRESNYDRGVGDDEWYKPHRTPTPPRQPTPGELLFEFVRERDHKHFRCELRFHGESYGWEAQFLERGELLLAHGGFLTRAAAEAWTTKMRSTIEGYL